MPIHPTLFRLLRKNFSELSKFSSTNQLTLEQMRYLLSAPSPRLTTQKASYQDIDFIYNMSLRCYTPHGYSPTDYLPVVIYIPGTAFVMERIDVNISYCSILANHLQMKIIHLPHRLAPEHRFPIYLNDSVEGIQWVYEHADILAIDPLKITLWGESSGGNIVATCTHLLRDKGLRIVKHQTLFYPGVDAPDNFTCSSSRIQYGNGFVLDRLFGQWMVETYLPANYNTSDPLIAPLHFSNFSDLPSATIITAECDPLRDEAETYAQKLVEAGVKVKLKRYEGMIHNFMRYIDKIPEANQALEFAREALSEG